MLAEVMKLAASPKSTTPMVKSFATTVMWSSGTRWAAQMAEAPEGSGRTLKTHTSSGSATTCASPAPPSASPAKKPCSSAILPIVSAAHRAVAQRSRPILDSSYMSKRAAPPSWRPLAPKRAPHVDSAIATCFSFINP